MFIMAFRQSQIIPSTETLLYTSQTGNQGTHVEVSMGKSHVVKKMGGRPSSEAIIPAAHSTSCEEAHPC
jgi:hypothetical protein